MLRLFQSALLAVLLTTAVRSASAFSLLGPFDANYQTAALGYQQFVSIGGPMNIGEEYHWNLPTVVYGYDQTFLDYFGQQGVNAAEAAFAIFNALPTTSQMSSNLAEYATDTKRINYQASALGLIDMKSTVMSLLMEQLGLANPSRFVWTLRDRRIITIGGVTTTNYLVIKRNFDPVPNGTSLAYSSFVNDVLYSYRIGEFRNPNFADAVEFAADPLAIADTAVASYATGYQNLFAGEFFLGLTRDDVGGIRYLLRTDRFHTELLSAGVITATTITTNIIPPPPWSPVGTPATTNRVTNTVVNQAIRPGVGKVTFARGQFDSLIGAFITTTNVYTGLYVTNSSLVSQTLTRVLVRPDILLTAEDLGLDTFGNPFLLARNIVFNNLSTINGQPGVGGAGPGTIQPQAVFRFSNIGPYFYNLTPFSLDEASAFTGVLWGSFDGSTNPPIVFPNWLSIQQLEQQILSGP